MPLDGLYSEAAPASLVRGKIANTPANAAASVWVILPSFDPTAKWGPCPWTPHGTTLPQKGADCLIAFDDQRLPWLIAWTGPWT